MAHRYRGADVLLVLRLVTRRLSGRADSKDKLAEGSFPFPGCPGPIFLFLPEEKALPHLCFYRAPGRKTVQCSP